MRIFVEVKPCSERNWEPIVECETREQAQQFIADELEIAAGEYRIVEIPKH